jgi:signal transduction histidine kinase
MQAHTQSTSAARALTPFCQPEAPRTGSSVPPTAVSQTCSISDASGLAHDAGNLLGGLSLYCDLLDRPGVLQPQHRHYAAELRGLAERSARLLERLLSPSEEPTSDTGAASALLPNPRRATQDVSAVLRELAPVLSLLAAPAAVVEVEAPPAEGSFVPAALTPEVLERIVVNLVCNAAQALAVHGLTGRIRVTLLATARRLRLQVRDDGPGLPPALAAALLAPAPLPQKTRRGRGHRIVYELGLATGGHLAVRSRPGRGTCFVLDWTASVPVATELAGSSGLSASGRATRQREGTAHAC